MKKRCTLLINGLSCFILLSSGQFKDKQKRIAKADAGCEKHIERSYSLLLQAVQKQRGRIAVVRFQSETVSIPPGQKKPQKSISQFVLMSRGEHSYLSDGQVAIYRDDQTQVCVIHPQQTILITYAEPQSAGDLTPWFKLRQELLTQSRITQCKLISGRQGMQRRIVALPKPQSTLQGRLASIEYYLDEQTDVMRKMVMHYPAGNSIISSGLLIQGQTWKEKDPAVDTPALRHVLGPDNKLLPAFRAYELQDQRQG